MHDEIAEMAERLFDWRWRAVLNRLGDRTKLSQSETHPAASVVDALGHRLVSAKRRDQAAMPSSTS
jgi:hypothetical protein